MTLADLDKAIGQIKFRIYNKDPRVSFDDVAVFVSPDSIPSNDVKDLELYENDDEETYREHIRCGGKREFSVIINYTE